MADPFGLGDVGLASPYMEGARRRAGARRVRPPSGVRAAEEFLGLGSLGSREADPAAAAQAYASALRTGRRRARLTAEQGRNREPDLLDALLRSADMQARRRGVTGSRAGSFLPATAPSLLGGM